MKEFLRIILIILVPIFCLSAISCSEDEDDNGGDGDELTQIQPSLSTTLAAINDKTFTPKALIKELTVTLTEGESSDCKALPREGEQVLWNKDQIYWIQYYSASQSMRVIDIQSYGEESHMVAVQCDRLSIQTSSIH